MLFRPSDYRGRTQMCLDNVIYKVVIFEVLRLGCMITITAQALIAGLYDLVKS